MGDDAATVDPSDVETISVETKPAAMEKMGTMKKLQTQATGLRRKSIEVAKKNPKKAASCGTCVCLSIVACIVLGVAGGVGLFYARHFFFGGNSRTAKAGGAAMSQGGRETLIPVSHTFTRCCMLTMAVPSRGKQT